MLVSSITLAADTVAAGLFLSPFGIALLGAFGVFGLFIPLILILLVANTVGGRSRASGDPSGIGLVVGFLILIVVMLAFRVIVS